MKVSLIRMTPNAEKLIASAGRLCYSPVGIDEIEKDISDKTVDRMVDMFATTGHHSPIEHVSFTFGIEGVSRVTETQLVRHRLNSYSIQSSRYVSRDNFKVVEPLAIARDEELSKDFHKILRDIANFYEKATENGVKKEDARYLIPQGLETKIVVTMNGRNLYHFLRLRTCKRAQWEIRELANKMLELVKKECPILFKTAGPMCLVEDCPEGPMTCGSQEKMRERYLD